jgi:hypothetical protein
MRAAEAESRPRPNGSKRPQGRPEETKRDKFKRLAKGRMHSAIKRIRMLARMGGNASAYEYDEADVEKIVFQLQEEVAAVQRALKPKTRQASIDFDFD